MRGISPVYLISHISGSHRFACRLPTGASKHGIIAILAILKINCTAGKLRVHYTRYMFITNIVNVQERCFIALRYPFYPI